MSMYFPVGMMLAPQHVAKSPQHSISPSALRPHEYPKTVDTMRWLKRSSNTSRSGTTANDGTHHLTCSHQSSSKLDTSKKQQRESTITPAHSVWKCVPGGCGSRRR